jgi:hypothetical protein
MTATDLMTSVHDAGPRRATSYPLTPAPYDPELGVADVTIGWPMIIVALLVFPLLGAAQLAHRHDVPVRLRVYIAVLALMVVVMAWAECLRVLPLT